MAKRKSWTLFARIVVAKTDIIIRVGLVILLKTKNTMKRKCRDLVRGSFKRRSMAKTGKTVDIVGCSLDSLCVHLLETWENNYGQEWKGEKYQIDHIVPLSIADTEQDVVRLCHYMNLQMLTPEDNRKKGVTNNSVLTRNKV